MPIATEPTTAEQLWVMPRSSHLELINGEMRPMTPAGFGQGRTAMRLGARLLIFVEQQRLGTVVSSETGFILRRNPDTVRAVDVGFVRADRIPTGRHVEKYFEGAPDLAAEVVSPGDSSAEVREKIADYLNAGTQMVLVLRPRSRSLEVYRPQEPPLTLGPAETFCADPVIPGFRCNVGELFE